MLNALRRLIQRYGFFKREPAEMADFHASMASWSRDRPGQRIAQAGFLPGSDNWHEVQFFTEHQARTERLAQIASEISSLNVKRLKAKEQKKNQKVFEDQMTALMAERLRIETGKETGQ